MVAWISPISFGLVPGKKKGQFRQGQLPQEFLQQIFDKFLNNSAGQPPYFNQNLNLKRGLECFWLKNDDKKWSFHSDILQEIQNVKVVVFPLNFWNATVIWQFFRVILNFFYECYYLKNKVGVVDFANAQGLVMF